MKTTANDRRIGDDLVITKTTRRAAGSGTWAIGTIAGYRFNALVFPAHAECPDYELGSSRISKLWLQELGGGATAANFDRGWDTRPRTKLAGKITDFLAANLADLVYRN